MNGNELLAAIKRKGKAVKGLCEALNISTSSFYKKLKGLSEFTKREIVEIKHYLGLTLEETRLFFFAEMVL